jgi:hypothetical protein
VNVGRLQDISEEDAKSEGCEAWVDTDLTNSYRLGYIHLWDAINGKKHPWSSNPFVWKIGLKRV